MGPSGSGKTTLLNCLSLLDDIDEGSIILAGSDVRKMKDAARTAFRGKHMGFIFQAFNLIPVFTAAENVELPLLLNGANPRQARAAAVETLEKVGLAQRVNHRPNELSGGEQQRVAVARALAGRPRIVWADEPTGNLDSETAKHVVQMLAELHRQGMTVMLVTHDPQIGGVANRLIQMRDGQIIGDKRRPA
jgi:putative ABC transport system ATP-binding protein